MEAKATLRQWGSSLGIVIPKNIIDQESLSEGQEITLDIKKKNLLREVFGTLKGPKTDSQKMSDENRKEWY